MLYVGTPAPRPKEGHVTTRKFCGLPHRAKLIMVSADVKLWADLHAHFSLSGSTRRLAACK